MFSLTLHEQEQISMCCEAVHIAHTKKDEAVLQNSEAFGIAKAQLQSQIARLFAVVAAIEAREGHGSQEEPPF